MTYFKQVQPITADKFGERQGMNDRAVSVFNRLAGECYDAQSGGKELDDINKINIRMTHRLPIPLDAMYWNERAKVTDIPEWVNTEDNGELDEDKRYEFHSGMHGKDFHRAIYVRPLYSGDACEQDTSLKDWVEIMYITAMSGNVTDSKRPAIYAVIASENVAKWREDPTVIEKIEWARERAFEKQEPFAYPSAVELEKLAIKDRTGLFKLENTDTYYSYNTLFPKIDFIGEYNNDIKVGREELETMLKAVGKPADFNLDRFLTFRQSEQKKERPQITERE